MIAGALVYYHGAHTLDDLRGVGRQSPWLTGALVVAAVAMVGLPPTGGFFGKWNIILGALEAEHYFAAFAVLASTLLTLAYFLKIFSCWFHHPQHAPSEPLEVSNGLRFSLGAISISMIALGLMSDTIFRFLIESITNGGV